MKILSAVGLLLTIAPAILVFAQLIPWAAHTALMLLGAALWFGSAPFWIGRERGGS